METEKTCLDCGNPIHGRADKKFCNDLCRNNYNNQLNSNSYNLVRNINNILKRNRRILEELNPTGKTKTTMAKMAAKGFNFKYLTNKYDTQNGKTYHFCYEYGYLPLENDEVLLVKREEKAD
jgi:predicted nucleic acid-binding Zn ribbon protein